MSSLFLAARRLKPPTLWKRQHGEIDSELMTQTTVSSVLFLYPHFLLTLEVGFLGGSVHSPPVCPGIFGNIHFCVTIKLPLSLSKVPAFGDTLYGCSMQKAWEVVRQGRGVGHRQDYWHLL